MFKVGDKVFRLHGEMKEKWEALQTAFNLQEDELIK